jgi:hypothetical protein
MGAAIGILLMFCGFTLILVTIMATLLQKQSIKKYIKKKEGKTMGRPAVDMGGETHGVLKVLGKSETKGKDSIWKCECLFCGSEVEYRRTQILRSPKKCKMCR